MKTTLHFFPFDLFGSSGTRAGIELLADAVREMLEDNRRERTPTRARTYSRHVRLHEWTFDKLAGYQDWRERANAALKKDERDFIFWLSGNHLGVLPVYDCLAERPEETLVIQFDAHLDIHNLEDCTKELSHGNFVLHAKPSAPAVINLGHRDLLLKSEYVSQYYADAYSALEVTRHPANVIESVRACCERASRIWVDIDCDVFDVAYFPAVAQALPFGLSTQFFLHLLDALWSEKVVGLSLSEFDTARDVRDQSLATLVWLIEWALLRIYEK